MNTILTSLLGPRVFSHSIDYWHLVSGSWLPIKDSKLIDSQKSIIYPKKKSIKTLFIIRWNALDAFYDFFSAYQVTQLIVNKKNHWNNQ